MEKKTQHNINEANRKKQTSTNKNQNHDLPSPLPPSPPSPPQSRISLSSQNSQPSHLYKPESALFFQTNPNLPFPPPFFFPLNIAFSGGHLYSPHTTPVPTHPQPTPTHPAFPPPPSQPPLPIFLMPDTSKEISTCRVWCACFPSPRHLLGSTPSTAPAGIACVAVVRLIYKKVRVSHTN